MQLNKQTENNTLSRQGLETLNYSVLASGSSGNCIYVESATYGVLIDAGLSGKRIEGLLAQINRSMQDVDAIFVTHEHKDHVHGVGVLSRKYQLPIYANKKTWSVLPKLIGKIDPDLVCYIEPEETISVGDIDVFSYEVSHDAIQPQFYSLQRGDKQFVLLTDTGYVSNRLSDILYDADSYLIESNHEVEMLRYGRYPWSLKQRILSDKGHLSNEDGAIAMTNLIGNNTKHIFLGHLSQDNNTKQLAMDSMTSILQQYDLAVNEDFQIHMTDPAQATSLFKL